MEKPPDGQLFDWSTLANVPVDSGDIDRLCKAITFWYDGYHLERHDNWKKNRQQYRCISCTCFYLVFTKPRLSTVGTPLSINLEKSNFNHSRSTHVTRQFRENSRKDMNLFRDNREIVDKLSASFKKNGKSIPLEAFKEKL